MSTYHIRGKNKTVNIDDGDPLAVGGEGKIFIDGGMVYKIYLNPDYMIPDAKIDELKLLTRSNIIKPEDVLLDGNNRPVGINMKYVDGHPLCKLFVNKFKKEHNVDNRVLFKIIDISKETVVHIHDKSFLMVDGNEGGYIVSKDFTNVFFIDVNAYQTPHFPADAIKLFIKDFHTQGYTEYTDWFSWGVVMCWLLVGIHPFKGTHPKYPGKDLDVTLQRMKDNVSIYNKDVRMPALFSRNLHAIPSNYTHWFIDEFEKGKRTLPPGMPTQIMITPVYTKIIRGTKNFDIVELKSFDGDVLQFRKIAGRSIITIREDSPSTFGNDVNIFSHFVDSVKIVQLSDRHDKSVQTMGDVILDPLNLKPILISTCSDNEAETKARNCIFSETPDLFKFGCGLSATSRFVSNNILYVKNGKHLYEMDFRSINGKILVSHNKVWNVLRDSSKMFDGFLGQRGLDKVFLYIPFPDNHIFVVKQIPELNSYRLVEGKYQNGVCMIIGKTRSEYDKIILRFLIDGTYDCRIIKDVDLGSINFAVLDNGICASLEVADGNSTLDLFRNKPFKPEIKSISDPDLNADMSLWKDGTNLLFSSGHKLYGIKMRK